jgi:hypothetical protein
MRRVAAWIMATLSLGVSPAPAPEMPGGANRKRACALAVILLCLFPSANGIAGEPASVLPQGVFATDDGCTMLSQAGGADDIDATDFFVLSDGELTGMDLACHFTDAEPSGDGKGKSWVVKASCDSGAPGVPAVFTIEDAGGGLFHVTMNSEGDVDDLGEFAPCQGVAE